MPSWSELQQILSKEQPSEVNDKVESMIHEATAKLGEVTGQNVIFYASSFLQKPFIPGAFTSINMEDVNGFMSGIYKHEFEKGVLVMLHTPGGQVEAAQTIVEYLRSKFDRFDVMIPTYAMSAGTIIALGSDRIIMGHQSQLGPTDPQLVIGDMQYSAHSIVEQFNEAMLSVIENPELTHAWTPILHTFGPALLSESKKAIKYSDDLVKGWLTKYMFSNRDDSIQLAEEAVNFFSSKEHGSHGLRISRDIARKYQLNVYDLEASQELQDAALTLYHLATIAFEVTAVYKIVSSSNGTMWIKNWLAG